MNGQKHIHFIGICGVAMGALATTFKENGWKVTGSDVGFYPPISTHLLEKQIEFYPGWHPDKMGTPDLVVVGNVVSSTNPEWKYVKDNGLNYRSYPEIIAEFFVKPNSIVCAGTYGKTTSTALLSWIFLNNGFNPSYMFGGLSLNQLPSAHLTDSEWNILEGDEYKSARWDMSPKFSHYEPKHLLLTAVTWDHADIYKTEKDYRKAFQKLVDGIPEDGYLVVSERVDNLKLPDKKITYGKDEKNDFVYKDIKQSEKGISFIIVHKGVEYQVQSPCLGEYMADNITGCFALAFKLGIEPGKILENVKNFIGMKRRLEKRCVGKVTVIDDIAHSPTKAESVIKTLRQVYDGKIFVIFEPNSGNRMPEAIPGYDKAFSLADEVIIPRLTKIKHDKTEARPLEGDELATIISQTHRNTTYIEEDSDLVKYILGYVSPGSVVAFLGSHGFRGMIEEIVKQLEV